MVWRVGQRELEGGEVVILTIFTGQSEIDRVEVRDREDVDDRLP